MEEDYEDNENLDTPKLDVSGIKLESLQKEKNSFLDDLKKQSFLISNDSNKKDNSRQKNDRSNVEKQGRIGS